MDIALVSVMKDSMLKVSEAAALTWRDVHLTPNNSGVLTPCPGCGPHRPSEAQVT